MPTKIRAIATTNLCGEGRARLDSMFDLDCDPWLAHVPIRLLNTAEMVDRVRSCNARVLIIEADPVPAEVISACDALAAIGDARGDPVNVDVGAATDAGIAVINTPGRNAVAVAEYTIGLIIALARGIVAADADIRAGVWAKDGKIAQQRHRGPAIGGSTLGLVGLGAVGHEVATRAHALGMKVVAHDPYADPATTGTIRLVELDEMLTIADFVSVHAALTDETTGLLGHNELASMRQGAYLVNTAREPIVDREALIEALESGHLGGAALDHFEGEYIAPDSPLCAFDNVILSPHIAGASTGADEAHTTSLADSFEALLAGKMPPNALNPDAFERSLAKLFA